MKNADENSQDTECLLRLGREAEARPLLIGLGRGTAATDVQQRVAEYLQRLGDGEGDR